MNPSTDLLAKTAISRTDWQTDKQTDRRREIESYILSNSHATMVLFHRDIDLNTLGAVCMRRETKTIHLARKKLNSNATHSGALLVYVIIYMYGPVYWPTDRPSDRGEDRLAKRSTPRQLRSNFPRRVGKWSVRADDALHALWALRRYWRISGEWLCNYSVVISSWCDKRIYHVVYGWPIYEDHTSAPDTSSVIDAVC